MKQFVFTFFLVFFVINVYSQNADNLVETCSSSMGEDATYLKDFQASLAEAPPNQRAPYQKFTVVLSKNTKYRFTICNSEDTPGIGILKLLDANKLLGSSYNESTGKDYHSFNFPCTKTGVYHLLISFRDGKEGKAVAIMSYLGK